MPTDKKVEMVDLIVETVVESLTFTFAINIMPVRAILRCYIPKASRFEIDRFVEAVASVMCKSLRLSGRLKIKNYVDDGNFLIISWGNYIDNTAIFETINSRHESLG